MGQHFYQVRGIGGTGDPWVNFDGRLNAPAGAAQFPTILNTYHPGGTSNARYRLGLGGGYQPPWWVAGVDYYSGCPHGTSLKDPATISGAGFSIAGQQLTVTGNNITLDGYDFSLEGGWFVHITGNNCTITNNVFKVGSNATNALWIDNTATNAIVRYNTFDGNTGAATPGAFIELNGIGTLYFEYNYINTCWAEAIQGGINQTASGVNWFIRYNIIFNVGYSNGSPHADVMQIYNPGGNMDSLTIGFNLIIQNHSIVTGPQGLSLHSANVPQFPVLAESVSNNTFVTGGASTIGQAAIINPTNLNGNCVFQNNYCDPTGTAFEALQFFDNDVGGGGSGAFSGTLNGYASQAAWNSAGSPGGNIIMTDGSVWGTQ